MNTDWFLLGIAYNVPLLRSAAEKLFCRRNGPGGKLPFYSGLLMLSLHKGRYEDARRIESLILANPELKDQWHFSLGDFTPSRLSHESRFIRVIPDKRIEELAVFLFEGIDALTVWIRSNFPGFKDQTTFFLMDGTGPSPFCAELGDVYLKTGHYTKTGNDREIVHHALVHEITHLYLRNVIGFKITQDDFGVRKLLDEGYAQMCGYRAAGVYEEKRAHADTCAAAALAPGLNTFSENVTNWENTVFTRKYYPLYQCAFSLTAFIEEKYGSAYLNDMFKASTDEKILPDPLITEWASLMNQPAASELNSFFRIADMNRPDEKTLQIFYSSEHPVYPLSDVIAQDETGTVLPLEYSSKYRYSMEGSFLISVPSGKKLNLTIVSKGTVQRETFEI